MTISFVGHREIFDEVAVKAWVQKTLLSCTNVCPFGLAPANIARAYDKKDAVTLDKLVVNACMECGCCSFVCPANRPLVQTNKLAKAFLKEEKAKEDTKA